MDKCLVDEMPDRMKFFPFIYEKPEPIPVKVGDTICDCRGKHVKIAEIEYVYGCRINLRWLVPGNRFIPWSVFDKMIDGAEWIERRLPQMIFDAELHTEDGFCCSWSACARLPEKDENGKWICHNADEYGESNESLDTVA